MKPALELLSGPETEHQKRTKRVLVMVALGFTLLLSAGGYVVRFSQSELRGRLELIRQHASQPVTDVTPMQEPEEVVDPTALEKVEPGESWKRSNFYRAAKSKSIDEALQMVAPDVITDAVVKICQEEKVSDHRCICYLSITEEGREVTLDESGAPLDSKVLTDLQSGRKPASFLSCPL